MPRKTVIRKFALLCTIQVDRSDEEVVEEFEEEEEESINLNHRKKRERKTFGVVLV